MRVVIGGIGAETTAFLNKFTTLEDYKRRELYFGDEVFDAFQGKHAAISAFIKTAETLGIKLIPTIVVPILATGVIEQSCFDFFLGKLIDGIRSAGKIDGVLIRGHGAMCVEGVPDGDGELLTRVRKEVGPDIPIVVTTDSHANFTKMMVEKADVFIGYDTNPHIDGYERAVEATQIIYKIIQGEISPTMALSRPNMLVTTHRAITTKSYGGPMYTMMKKAHEIEKYDNVVNVTVAAGFPTNDKPEMGIACIVTTNNDIELAKEYADQLAGWAWRHRRYFLADAMSLEDAIHEAILEKEGPIVMGDTGDSAGGGGPSDGTAFLAELINQGAKNALVFPIADSEAVEKAIEVGVGKEVTMKVGGKSIPDLTGEPIEVTGYVKLISDGKFIRTGPMGDGLKENLGRTVVLDCKGIEIILTERPYCPSHWPYPTFGIDVTKKKIVFLKSSSHFRQVWAPYAKRFIDVDTPGIANALHLSALEYKNLCRPIFPLDVDLLGIAELKKTVYKDRTVRSIFFK